MVKVAADKHSMWISVQYNFYHPTPWGRKDGDRTGWGGSRIISDFSTVLLATVEIPTATLPSYKRKK